MYLTKFPLNMTRRETRRMLASPYRMHAALSGCFPDSIEAAEGRLLWRVDREADGTANLYIVSPAKPSLVGLDEQVGWPDLDKQWQTRCYDEFLKNLRTGQTYGFRLCANPVVSRTAIKNGRGDSKRVPHLTALQQSAWLAGAAVYDEAGVEPPKHVGGELASRANRNGFEIVQDDEGALQLAISEMTTQRFRQGEKGRAITLTTARYDGVLRVVDAGSLRRALVCGIGHGKGFGCGLLTIAAVNTP